MVKGGERVAPRPLLLDGGDRERVAGLDRGDGALGRGLVAEVELVELLAVELGQPGREGRAGGVRELGLDGPVFLRP